MKENHHEKVVAVDCADATVLRLPLAWQSQRPTRSKKLCVHRRARPSTGADSAWPVAESPCFPASFDPCEAVTLGCHAYAWTGLW